MFIVLALYTGALPTTHGMRIVKCAWMYFWKSLGHISEKERKRRDGGESEERVSEEDGGEKEVGESISVPAAFWCGNTNKLQRFRS